MAAEFKRPFAEYNIECDPEAAHLVFTSGIPMQIITWDIGHTVKFDQAHVDRLANSDRPLANRLAAAIHAWQAARRGPNYNPTPSLYDPMAIATMIQPNLCTWRTGTVSIELAGTNTYGISTFKDHADGPHRIAWDADRTQSLDFCIDRILSV
jgi:inosine-uridine nucleoside N-ribohydrolase